MVGEHAFARPGNRGGWPSDAMLPDWLKLTLDISGGLSILHGMHGSSDKTPAAQQLHVLSLQLWGLNLMWRRIPFLIRTDIPPMLRYPVHSSALMFVSGLVSMFYSPELQGKVTGLMNILAAITKRPSSRTKAA